jgi:hypothetical protein
VAGFDQLLRDHVQPGGWVDYSAIRDNRQTLDTYVHSLAGVSLLRMPHDQRLATLINAYNAFTLQWMIDQGAGDTLESIMDTDRPFDAQRFNLAGEMLSLNQLEHELIRPVFDEPRIHWAVVCAAFSCPPLRPEAYTGEALDQQLAEQEAFVLNLEQPRFVQQRGDTLAVTKLFEWYGEDFGDDWRDYVTARVDAQPASYEFLDYDWASNDVSNRPQ